MKTLWWKVTEFKYNGKGTVISQEPLKKKKSENFQCSLDVSVPIFIHGIIKLYPEMFFTSLWYIMSNSNSLTAFSFRYLRKWQNEIPD